MTKPAAITDADRELFIDLFAPGWKHPESSHRWEVTSGGMDDDPRMQALAAHRIQARKEAIEECAALIQRDWPHDKRVLVPMIRALGEGVEPLTPAPE